MSPFKRAYLSGLEASLGALPDVDFVTPNLFESTLESTRALIDTTARDIASQLGRLNANQSASWVDYWQRWTAFYNQWSGWPTLAILAIHPWAVLGTFENEVWQWRYLLTSLGGTFTTPLPGFITPLTPRAPEGIPWGSRIFWGAVVIGGLVAVGYAARGLGAFKGAMSSIEREVTA